MENVTMLNESQAFLRDAIVLTYMIFLRVGVPLLVIVFTGKWIQRKMAETDLREQRARMGEPYCWDMRTTAQTAYAQRAAAAHPELPCWLAVQTDGGGLTQACFNCPRYAVDVPHVARETVEVN
jgi:hypothetical protein